VAEGPGNSLRRQTNSGFYGVLYKAAQFLRSGREFALLCGTKGGGNKQVQRYYSTILEIINHGG